MPKQDLDFVRSCLDYDGDSGIFVWKKTLSPISPAGTRAGGSINQRYRRLQICGVNWLEHRLAWFHFYGELPECPIDHINGDKQDNRISNLRITNGFQNMKNTLKHQNGKKFGVHFVRNKWHASIRYKNENMHIGVFDTELEAAGAVYGFIKGKGLLEYYNL